MECPKCHETMEVIEDTSFGRDEKQYMRAVHHCKKDDIWVTVEVPKES